MANERILYVDPWSGISGDMFLASLVDSDRAEGRLERVLKDAVAALAIDGASVEVSRDTEWGVACTRITVLEGSAPELRHLPQMETIIAGSGLPAAVIARSLSAVRRLAEAEASVHGCSVDHIHFHEVGAVDTLVDVVGTFALVEALGIARVAVGTIPVGGGTVEIAHGRMGVPAPATARLLEGYPIVGGPEDRELTTPTGALLISEMAAVSGPLPPMEISSIGHGAGTMKLKGGPNVLRVLIGTAAGAEAHDGTDDVVELQTNLDDVSGEVVGHACRVLREAGALDVWTVPAMMKKERPAVVMHVLVTPEREAELLARLFAETGTLGVRRQTITRSVADRGVVTVDVSGEAVHVKWGRWQGRLTSLATEYEDAVAASAATGIPLKLIMELAAARAKDLVGERARGVSRT
jgi:pyridinium-3,5-bisthiocarboxylic acid mononucleotide nickel chelatase